MSLANDIDSAYDHRHRASARSPGDGILDRGQRIQASSGPRKKYRTKSAATPYRMGWISRARPVAALSSTYEMTPAPMPLEMEYVNGISVTVRKAGTAIV